MTVHRPPNLPSARQAYQCLISHFPSSLGACKLKLYIHYWLIDSCQNSVSLTSIPWPHRGLRYRPTEFECFLEVIRWQVATFQMIAGSSSFFFNAHKKVEFMCRTFKILISTWPRTRKFNRLLHAEKVIAFGFSHCQALITVYVQFLCSDWSRQVSSRGNFMQRLETCLLIAEADRVLCHLVMF